MNTQQNPTTVACEHIFSFRHIYRINGGFAPKVDRRTKFGRAVLQEYYRLLPTLDLAAAKRKQEARRKMKTNEPINILHSPIVKDWMQNKGRLGFRATSAKLTDGHRNHWAKDEKDSKILSILIKYNTPTPTHTA